MGDESDRGAARIYARESAAVVVFISADYAGRDWTRLERRAAFSRAVTEAGVYVLPARFDDSERSCVRGRTTSAMPHTR